MKQRSKPARKGAGDDTQSLQAFLRTPPITVEQHQALRRKRTEQRRLAEAAREDKAEAKKDSW